MENQWGATPDLVSTYAYENDELGRRTSCVRTGAAFGTNGSGVGDHHDVWEYNDRNELTGSTRRAGTAVGSGVVSAGLCRYYDYDPIGNRQSQSDGAPITQYYCANELNQYTATDDTGPAQDCPSPTETFSYDADGNLIESNNIGEIAPGSARRVKYSWDAENRLITVEPVTPQTNDKKVEFTYDYMGRRVEKRTYVRGASSWGTPVTRRWIWYNWLPLLELDGDASNAVLRKYTWGLDLAGQDGSANSIEQAGGVGGLLAVRDQTISASFVYLYDANGNVGQLADLDASSVANAIVARYEYDAYGNNLLDSSNTTQSGPYAHSNNMRFSTKPFDVETHLGYFGHRYLSCDSGRWLNRDPLAESSDKNLLRSCHNDLVNIIDPLGLEAPTHACCQYREAAHSSDAPTGNFSTPYRYQETKVCTQGSTPTACCACSSRSATEQLRNGGKVTVEYQTRLVSAHWGECCWCTVYYSRAADWITWYAPPVFNHAVISIHCDNGRKFIADHASDSGPQWIDESIIDQGGNMGRGQGFPPSYFPVLVRKMRVDCAAAEKMIACTKILHEKRQPYNDVTDCHWFANLMMDIGDIVGFGESV